MKPWPVKKRFIFASTVFALLIVCGFLLYPYESDQPEYIFDKQYDIDLSDVEKSNSALARRSESNDTEKQKQLSRKNDADEDVASVDMEQIFSDGLINAHTTIKYFKHLEHKFRKSTGLGEHLEKVKEFLFSNFSEKEARTLFDTYKQHLQCKMDLMEEFKSFTGARNAGEAIATLKRIQSYRRQQLGEELADKLYGAQVKAKEYALRRSAIITDETLYGAEKEKRLNQLNKDMWGDEAADVDERTRPYNRYQEKLKIYRKDLAEMDSEAKKQEKINSFRKQFFEPKTVERLNAIDRRMAEKETREQKYQQKAEQIRDNAELDKTQKKEKIRQLQQETFGEDAEAFRRREDIRKNRKEFIRENQDNAPVVDDLN
ncbi:MAG: lipase secretion chaperone [Thermodesulfobacteriota bacterium]